MPSFNSNTVHGLSADVYFAASGSQPAAVRTLGEIQVTVENEVLNLTANDLGQFEPVKVLRRGDRTQVSLALTDMSGLATLSGIVFPFATLEGSGIVLPVSEPGDDFLALAKELRLVLRDGSATMIFPSAVVTEVGELVLSEEEQNVYPVTFTCFRATVSGGHSTPFVIISGSVTSGGY
jgi:hypothetical protein